jgi:hypothetical protein
VGETKALVVARHNGWGRFMRNRQGRELDIGQPPRGHGCPPIGVPVGNRVNGSFFTFFG